MTLLKYISLKKKTIFQIRHKYILSNVYILQISSVTMNIHTFALKILHIFALLLKL